MLNGLITDIHCHIIPGVDDGSRSLDRSLGLVDLMYQEGIRRVIATPHWGIRNQGYDQDIATANFMELRSAALKKYPDMEFYMGNEIFIVPGYPIGLRDGKSISLAKSAFALVEFPYDAPFEEILRGCYNVTAEGYAPIIAHVERYESCCHLKAVRELATNGVLIQVNSESVGDHVLGMLGGNPQIKFVQKLLKEGLVDFVATDCHDLPGRWPVLRQAIEVMTKLVGEEGVQRIMIDNPTCILENSFIR